MRIRSVSMPFLLMSFLVVAVALLLNPMSAEATLTFEYQTCFSGGCPPSPGPWLTVTFTDVAPASVQMTATANFLDGQSIKGLTPTGKVNDGGLLFNLDPTLTLGSVRLSYISGNAAGFAGISADAFKADGTGNYDVAFAWSNNTSGFDKSDTVSYLFTGGSGFSSSSFAFLSSKGTYRTAAKLTGIAGLGANDSGWVTVPEPSTLLLLGSGLTALGLWRRKRFKN